jgi:hypothetical protein
MALVLFEQQAGGDVCINPDHVVGLVARLISDERAPVTIIYTLSGAEFTIDAPVEMVADALFPRAAAAS